MRRLLFSHPSSGNLSSSWRNKYRGVGRTSRSCEFYFSNNYSHFNFTCTSRGGTSVSPDFHRITRGFQKWFVYHLVFYNSSFPGFIINMFHTYEAVNETITDHVEVKISMRLGIFVIDWRCLGKLVGQWWETFDINPCHDFARRPSKNEFLNAFRVIWHASISGRLDHLLPASTGDHDGKRRCPALSSKVIPT